MFRTDIVRLIPQGYRFANSSDVEDIRKTLSLLKIKGCDWEKILSKLTGINNTHPHYGHTHRYNISEENDTRRITRALEGYKNLLFVKVVDQNRRFREDDGEYNFKQYCVLLDDPDKDPEGVTLTTIIIYHLNEQSVNPRRGDNNAIAIYSLRHIDNRWFLTGTHIKISFICIHPKAYVYIDNKR